MTENGRSVLRRAARVLLACGVLSLGASGLWAQGSSGKVQGTVLDPTGQPIANAQVFVLGTSYAALTNEDGFYFINNVPAGVFSMRAQFIGYQPAQMEGIRILADQTLTADFRLSGAVALEAITITAAEQPIVPRDQVASKSIVTGEDVADLPVYDGYDVVQLQPGVIAGRGGQILIRGSRADEAVIFIDGAPVKRMDTNDAWMNVGSNMLAEVSVTTGAMAAQYGDAQAGVISFITASGGPSIVGTFAYETDEPLGKNYSTGFNRFEAALSGPVFGNLTFSIGGTLTGSLSSANAVGAEDIPVYTFYGTDTVVTVDQSGNDLSLEPIPNIAQYSGKCEPTDLNGDGSIAPNSMEDNYGVECQGRLRPYDWNTNLRGNAKLQFTYGSGSRISLSGLTDIAQNLNATNYNFENEAGTRFSSNMLVVNWVQQVFRGAQSELAFDVNLSYQTDRATGGQILREDFLGTRSPFMGIVLKPLTHNNDWDRFGPLPEGVSHGDTLPDGGWAISKIKTQEDWDMLIENVRYDRGTLRSYLDRQDVSTVTKQRMNAYGVTGFASNYGTDRGQDLRYERRYVGRAVVDWQADRYNRFQFGAEGTKASLGRYQMSLWRKSFGNGYQANPHKWGAFAQDRLDLGDVVLELGIRFDQYNLNSLFPLFPSRIFTNPAFDRQASVADMTCSATTANTESCDPDSDIWVNSRTHNAWAPRVRVSFPITDRTGFRLSYAHQTQVPDMVTLYNGVNNDLANTNTNDQFGGDADFGRTIQFEFGVRHAFTPDMVLDIAAYNKDKTSDLAYRILPVYDPFADRIANLNLVTNQDFGNVRGLDIQWIQRIGRIFSGQVSYTLQNSKSTGSDPTDYLNGLSRMGFTVTDDRPEAPQYTLRTRDDRRHSLQGSFSVSLPRDWGSLWGDWGFFSTFQFRSGLPYTILQNNGDGQTSGGSPSSTPAEPLQASETPWQKFVDLRITKGFRLGPTDWTLYADIRNLFNFTNKTNVFAETGDVVNDKLFEEGFLQPQLFTMQNDAQLAGVWTSISKGEGSDVRTVNAIDLTSISATCPGWAGAGGTAACVMLQRTEQRFGNGDGLYDVEEQTAAVLARYNEGNSPSRFYGAARRVRLGVQLSF